MRERTEGQNINKSWESVLSQDPNHERHLETPLGRFEALINIAKNGSMVIELMVMDESYRSWYVINSLATSSAGVRLTRPGAVQQHMFRTVSAVGAASRSDMDEKDWRITEFGAEARPALIYTWTKFIDHDIRAMGALSSRSQITKDDEGNFVISAPLTRANILLAVHANLYLREGDLKQMSGRATENIRQHLIDLRHAELINFEAINIGEPYSYFKISQMGKSEEDWSPYIDSQGRRQLRLSQAVKTAAKGISQGQDTFNLDDLIAYVKEKLQQAGASVDRSHLSSCLRSFTEQGLIEYVSFHQKKMSEVTLTEKGTIFVEEVLLPLMSWAEDLYSVPDINNIRGALARNSQSFEYLYSDIASEFVDKSPAKNRDPKGKTYEIMRLIEQGEGSMTVNQIARSLEISVGTVVTLMKPLITNDHVEITIGKSNRKYLKIKKK